ncbi:transmembrane protein 104-like isoform X2 [Styela clava]
MPESANVGAMYSPMMGFIYVFNLIVGTGALTMPKAFASAGWAAGIVLILFLAFMSYMSTTFVIEVMAIANAKLRHDKKTNRRLRNSIARPYVLNDGDTSSSDPYFTENDNADDNVIFPPNESTNTNNGNDNFSETRPLLDTTHLERKYNKNTPRSSLQEDYFKIDERIEMGQMADMFFNRVGRILFYLCISIYLYGDLAIYAAAVPKTLRDIACGNLSCSLLNATHTEPKDSDICWAPNISRGDAYRIFLGGFVLVLGPFTFFNVQKTKYLQLSTSVLRWVAFISMISLTIIKISEGKGQGHPKPFEFDGIPVLFGVCVYSFMCQHSLPSLITPIRNKGFLSKLLAADYSVILMFYLLLCLTAIYAFDNENLMDMYTLNFQDSCDVTDKTFLRYFLGLFPVFTLGTSFPIIAVTLRNNLKAMFNCNRSRPYPFVIDKIFFPILTIVPPVAVAFVTNDLTALVGYTGSYAGSGVQYIIPAFLVLLARQDANRVLGVSVASKNTNRSPFKRRGWIIAMFIWAIVCIAFVTANHIMSSQHHTGKNGTSWLESKWSWMDVGSYFSRHVHIS